MSAGWSSTGGFCSSTSLSVASWESGAWGWTSSGSDRPEWWVSRCRPVTGVRAASSRRSVRGRSPRMSASRSSSPSWCRRRAVREVTTLVTEATGVRESRVSRLRASGSAQPSASSTSGPSGPTTATIAPGVVTPTCSASSSSTSSCSPVAPMRGGAAAPGEAPMVTSSIAAARTSSGMRCSIRRRGAGRLGPGRQVTTAMVLYAPLSRLPRRCWFRRCALGFLPHLAEDLGEPDRSDEDGGGAAHADLVALEDPGGLQSLQICGDTHVPHQLVHVLLPGARIERHLRDLLAVKVVAPEPALLAHVQQGGEGVGHPDEPAFGAVPSPHGAQCAQQQRVREVDELLRLLIG